MELTASRAAAAAALTRQRLGQFFVAYEAVWILEGAARKWLAPSLQQPLYFLRVPIVLAMVYLALKLRRPPVPPAVALAGLTIAGLVTFTAVHVLAGTQSLISAGLGLRLYVEAWLVPLCLAGALEWRQVRAAVRFLVLTVPPMAVLAVLQARSPITAGINRIFASDGSDVFTTGTDVVRPAGTFTSSLGFSCYAILAVACVLAMAIDRPERWERWLLVAAAPAAGVMVFVSGSRSALLGSAAPLLLVLVVQAVRRPGAALRLGAGIGIAVVLAYSYAPRFAPAAVEGLRERTATADQSILERVLGDFSSWTHVVPHADPWGRGLGASTGGLANIGARADVEGELVRWVVEWGPPLFFVALAVRLLLCVLLLGIGLSVARRTGRMTPLVLLLGALPLLVTGSVTGQGSVNGFAAVAVGIIVAWRSRTPDDGRDAQAQRAPRSVASRGATSAQV